MLQGSYCGTTCGGGQEILLNSGWWGDRLFYEKTIDINF